jgi:hypothetical protein
LLFILKAGLFFFPTKEWGKWGKWKLCEFLVTRTELKITPVLIDATEGGKKKSKVLVATVGRGNIVLCI